VAYAEETNSMEDKPFNSLLRARLEQVAPLDRMQYYDALDKEKRIRTIGECAGIIAQLKCPGRKDKPCGKVGSLKPYGTLNLSRGQIRVGKVSQRNFHCPAPRAPAKNGAKGLGALRTGCGKSVSSKNLWNLAAIARDEIKKYLETHLRLSQQTHDDPGKVNTSENV